MAATIQSMSGLLHDIDRKVSNISYTANTRSAPRSSVAGRKRPVEERTVTAENDDASDNIVPPVSVVLFTDRFRQASDGYNSLTLSSKPTEAFLYDWYAKCLGATKGSTIVLTASLWASAVGNKVSTDNQGDAKLIIKLSAMLTTTSQLAVLEGPKPDASKDANYGIWEMKMKGICKSVTGLMNDFLIMREGKIGNAKTLTVGAMARRWKFVKFSAPTADELTDLSSSRQKNHTTTSSSSSSSSSASGPSCSSSSSTKQQKKPRHSK